MLSRPAFSALMVHGAGGGAWEWRVWQRVFSAQGVSAQALTLEPYPGDSVENGFARTTYAHYLQQLTRAQLHYGANVLIGASLGGLLVAELAAQAEFAPSISALVLVAPVPRTGIQKAPPVEPKRWAASADLANSLRALPDADAAAACYAHHQWRDESHLALGAAYAGRDFIEHQAPSLVLLAQYDNDLSNAALQQWANTSGKAVMQIPGASHAGLLLGRHASKAAELALQWLRAQFGN